MIQLTTKSVHHDTTDHQICSTWYNWPLNLFTMIQLTTKFVQHDTVDHKTLSPWYNWLLNLFTMIQLTTKYLVVGCIMERRVLWSTVSCWTDLVVSCIMVKDLVVNCIMVNRFSSRLYHGDRVFSQFCGQLYHVEQIYSPWYNRLLNLFNMIQLTI
jgi:hypothetical protein